MIKRIRTGFVILSLSTVPVAFSIQDNPLGILDQDHIAQIVDYKNNDDELLKQRIKQNHSTDSCLAIKGTEQNTFVDAIAPVVTLHMKSQKIYDSVFSGAYKLQENPVPVSLLSHPMCQVDQVTLRKTLRSAADLETVQMANEVALRYNDYREAALDGRTEGYQDVQRFWLKVMSCLGYSESLGTAESASSRLIASRYAPRDYSKPDGVKFYYDRLQRNVSSRLNIGLYQFSPQSDGNVNPCIYNWNREVASVNPGCHINPRATKNEMIHLLGSSRQAFNAYCGVNKVLQNFYTQVNSVSSKMTYPTNVMNNEIKDPSRRCVTLHMKSGLAYNHFGPFQNTTGSNLKKLLSCVLY